MNKCKKCKSKFSYKELMFLFWNSNYDYLVCKNCKSKYKVSFIYRIIFGIILVAIPLGVIQLIDISGIMMAIGYLIYAIILFVAAPLFIIYKVVDDTQKF